MLGSRDMTGTPFQYAALMALGASRMGVPGRVVTGAAPGRRGVVEHKDVGVWVELQLDDGTWRTLEPRRYVGADLVHDGDPDGAGDDPGGFVADLLDGRSRGHGATTGSPEEPMPQRAEDEADAVDREPIARPQVFLRVFGGVAATVVLALLLVPLGKVLRRARRRRTSSWSEIYVNGWQEVLDTARDRGTPVPDAWSRVAQASSLGAGLDLARRADSAVFAPTPPPSRDGEEFWDGCQELRRSLAAEMGTRRRLRAQFSPASLLAGWARRRRDDSPVAQVRDEDRRARRQSPAGA
jgi:hypothetical protein